MTILTPGDADGRLATAAFQPWLRTPFFSCGSRMCCTPQRALPFAHLLQPRVPLTVVRSHRVLADANLARAAVDMMNTVAWRASLNDCSEEEQHDDERALLEADAVDDGAGPLGCERPAQRLLAARLLARLFRMIGPSCMCRLCC